MHIHTVLLGLMYLGAGASTKGIAAIQNRMGIFMLEMLFLAFTSVSALPVSREIERKVGCASFEWIVYPLVRLSSHAYLYAWPVLQLFWLERPLYAYEVSNGYYGPGAYFVSKVSDLTWLLLRLFLLPSIYINMIFVIIFLCLLIQMLSDLIPLRVLPPLLLAAITKLLVGFRGGIYFFNYR